MRDDTGLSLGAPESQCLCLLIISGRITKKGE